MGVQYSQCIQCTNGTQSSRLTRCIQRIRITPLIPTQRLPPLLTAIQSTTRSLSGWGILQPAWPREKGPSNAHPKAHLGPQSRGGSKLERDPAVKTVPVQPLLSNKNTDVARSYTRARCSNQAPIHLVIPSIHHKGDMDREDLARPALAVALLVRGVLINILLPEVSTLLACSETLSRKVIKSLRPVILQIRLGTLPIRRIQAMCCTAILYSPFIQLILILHTQLRQVR